MWPASSSQAVITYGHSVRFEVRNVSAVTVGGLRFIGCQGNQSLILRCKDQCSIVLLTNRESVR